MFFQYHRNIRLNEHGRMEYPIGYRSTELQKALDNAANVGWTAASLSWKERGPGNVGGRTRPVLIDPDDPQNTWWAGSVSGGLWKTTNKGSTWTPVAEDLSMLFVGSLAMAESDHDIIYMGTGEGYGNADAADGDGIFKSTNKGVTWTHLSSTSVNNEDFRHVNKIVIDPSDEDIVLAATGNGIFRSTNGGTSWTRVYTVTHSGGYSPFNGVKDLRAQPGNFNRLIASDYGKGIYYSDNAGQSWSPSTATYLSWSSHNESYSTTITPRRIELAFSPSRPDTAYAAILNGRYESELLRSSDGGKSWSLTFEDKPTRLSNTNWLGNLGWYSNALAVHPFKPDTLFAGGIKLWRIRMSNSTTTLYLGPSVLDRGGTETWMDLTAFFASHFAGTVDYLVSEDDAVDVADSNYSTIEIRFGQGSQKAHRFTVAEDAGTQNNGGAGVLRSEYQYEDYVDVPLQVWDTDNNRQLMFSFRDQADDTTFNLIHYFVSSESGTRDQQSREYIYIHHYDYDTDNPKTEIAQDGGVVNGMLYLMWPTLNSSATWDPPNLTTQTMEIRYVAETASERIVESDGISNTPHVDHHSILPLPVNDTFWVLNTNDGGVALSTNGGISFSEKDLAGAGYNTSQFYGVAKKPGQAIYLGGTQDNGSWRSSNNPDKQDAWNAVLDSDGFEAVWHATDPNKAMATKQLSTVYRTLDGGTSFALSLTKDNALDGVFLSPLASSDEAPNEVYTVGRKGVYRTLDFGDNWSHTQISSNWRAWSGCSVRVSKANANFVWAGCGLESSTSGRKLHISRDKGKTFSTTENPNVTRPPNTLMSGLATHPTESATAYALFSAHGYAKVLETTDTGNTWVDLSSFNSSGNSTNGFPNVAVYDLLVMDHAPTVFWVGTDIGLFESRDSGANWSYTNNGLMAIPVWRMKFRDSEVIVATHGRGIWTVPAGDISSAIAGVSETLPTEFSLSQNYPNPFNASTNIQFVVPTEIHVRLAVYDVLGRLVSVLADRVYTPGTHNLSWNASAHASGVYFYRMESEGRLIGAKKMILLK